MSYAGTSCFAAEFGSIKYNDAVIDYSAIDEQSVLERADSYFAELLKAKDKREKQDLLQKAGGEYFILTRKCPQNVYYVVQLARVYDAGGKDRYAKGYFSNALMLDRNNPKTNYYIGEFYYRRNDYTRALEFYNIALDNGFGENYEILIKMAVICEKLGDLLRANQYYKKAYVLNPGNTKIASKIREIEKVKYKDTGYYRKTKGK